MKVLVTGGTGFIGANLVRKLLERGDEIASLAPIRSDGLGSITQIEGSILDSEVINDAVAGKDLVFHLAANSFVGKADEDLLADFEVNVRGTYAIASACQKHGAKMVFSSTSMVYGNGGPFAENSACSPLSTYAFHKLLAEQCCNQLAKGGLEVAIARLSNTYGPGQKNRVISDLFEKLSSNDVLEIRGNSADTRDFLFIDDAIGALLLLAKKGTGTYNAGNSSGIGIRELAKKIMQAVGKTVPTKESYDPQTATSYVIDNAKISALGWKPKTGLAEGLEIIAKGNRLP